MPGTYTFCGLQLVSPRLFDFLPAQPFCTLVDAYTEAMQAGVFVDGVPVPGSYWDDAGTVEAYLRIHGETKRLAKAGKAGGGLYDARVDRCGEGASHFFCVGAGASVDADVKGCDSVVSGASRVLSGSVLRQAVVAGGCVGGTLTEAACVAATDAGEETLPVAMEALGWRPEETGSVFLGARGSDRSFWRLYKGGQSAVCIRYSLERPENARYGGHARILAEAGVPVPAVLAEVPERHCLVLEDWGNDSLQSRMAVRPGRAETWYRPVIAALARLHREGTRRVRESGTELEAPFDAALYAWERGLFEKHLLVGRYGLDALPEGVSQELRALAGRLEGAGQVVVHRDFQSSNILFRGNRFAFIDFQGMRMGSAAYDLASLLYDPYVKLTVSSRERLIAEYGRCHPEHPDAVGLFYEGAVQRLVQALGAFGRLSSVGQASFTCHILPALENLLEAADACGLEEVGGLTEELIAREQRRCGA